MADIKQVTEIGGVSGFPINYFHITEAFLNQKTNSFRFTGKAKSKGEVQMTTAKWFRQKGTGRARQGALSNPHMKGGGKAHGPKPRYSPSKLNKRVKRSAWLSALAYHLERGTIFVIEDDYAATLLKTKQVVNVLEAAEQFGRAIICCPPDSPLVLSARNVHKVSVLPPERLNVGDMMLADCIVFTRGSLGTASLIATAMRDQNGIKRLALGVSASSLEGAEAEISEVSVAEIPEVQEAEKTEVPAPHRVEDEVESAETEDSGDTASDEPAVGEDGGETGEEEKKETGDE